MPLDDPLTITRHFEAVKGERSTWETLWQEVSDYGLARRGGFTEERRPEGRGKRTRLMYDNTMMVANELWANGVHTILTPTGTRWVHVEPADLYLLDVAEVADWFEEVEDIFVRDIERYESGFHDQISEVYTDIGAYGNGALATMFEPDFGLLFQSLPLAETYVEEDSYGRVHRIYRLFELTVSQMVERFGLDGVPARVRTKYDAGKVTERSKVLQALLPNPAYTPHTRFGVGVHQIKSWFIDYQEKKTLRVDFFRELPVAFGRLSKDADESYARGPGIQSLSDQRMIHKMKYTTLRGAEKAIDPPMLFPDTGYVTQVDLSPGGRTIYRAATPDAVRELYTRPGQGVDLGIQLVEHTQTNIRAAYHYELLQMIQDPRMTATQVLEISSRVQQILAPEMSRLHGSLLEPMVTRAFALELRNGRFPPVPPALAGAGVRFRYVSPVQRAQQVGEARAVMEAFNGALQAAQVDPRALDAINLEEQTRFLYKAFGVSPYLLRTPEAVAALQAGRAELQRQREQKEEAMMLAQALGKGGPGIKALAEATQTGREAA
jgi:hypothetical protein